MTNKNKQQLNNTQNKQAQDAEFATEFNAGQGQQFNSKKKQHQQQPLNNQNK